MRNLLRCGLLLSILFSSYASGYSYVDHFRLQDYGKMKPIAFFDLSGKRKTINSYRGKYVLLTFWATWCRACVSEMPALEKLARQFKHDNLVIAVISRNYPKNMGVPVEGFRLKSGLMNLEFLTDIDGGELHKEFNVTGLPTSLLIDRGGRVIGRLEGAAPWDHKDFIKFFQDVLDDKIKPPAVQQSLWSRFTKVFS